MTCDDLANQLPLRGTSWGLKVEFKNPGHKMTFSSVSTGQHFHFKRQEKVDFFFWLLLHLLLTVSIYQPGSENRTIGFDRARHREDSPSPTQHQFPVRSLAAGGKTSLLLETHVYSPGSDEAPAVFKVLDL